MKKLTFFLMLYSLALSYSVNAQIWMQPNKTIEEIRGICEPLFESMSDTIPDSVFYSEGSTYTQYRRFIDYWDDRLLPKQTMEDYYNANRFGQTQLNDIPQIPDPWTELGPYQLPQVLNTSAQGTGPVEFVSFHPSNSNKMLCGSLAGGLFYSTDAGSTWNQSGSDTKWLSSGCGSAVFDPADASGQTWYAISAGRNSDGVPSFIGTTGGVYMTSDAGANWTQIANYNDFTFGIWTRIFKIKVINGSCRQVFILTNCGLYYWEPNCSSGIGQILSGYFSDFAVKPGNNQIMYATENLQASNNSAHPASAIHYSSDGGQTWSTMSGLPSLMNDFNHLTLATTPANSNKLYVHAIVDLELFNTANANHQYHTQLFVYDGSTWTTYTNSFKVSFGQGYAFAVNPNNQNDVIMSIDDSPGGHIQRLTLSTSTLTAVITHVAHPDVEFIAFHPTNSGEFWVCQHGGILRYNASTSSWEWKNNGLGVMMCTKSAASVSDPDVLAIGAFHDGTVLSNTSYTPPTTMPSWKTIYWGDGQRPLIDPANVMNCAASSQYGYWAGINDGGNSTSGYFNQFLPTTTPPYHNIQLAETFFTEGTFNIKLPQYVYYSESNAAYGNPSATEDIYRSSPSFSGTIDQISNFQTLLSSTFSTLQHYDVAEMFSCPTNKDILLAVVQVKYLVSNSPVEEIRIYKNNAATQSASSAISSWTYISSPNPANGWFRSIAFDPENENIIYFTYNSSSINASTTSGQGTDMVYRVDYTNSSSPSTTDLTFNLPNTAMLSDGIAIEKGSDGNIYVSTDLGVFFINNTYINDQSFWHQFGELPHISGNGLWINYRKNVIRCAVNGRGMWEHNLQCPVDNSLSLSGAHSYDYYYEATNDIASTATIAAGRIITYRAGTYVDLLPGFVASANSTFHAFVHGCNQPGSSFRFGPGKENNEEESPLVNDKKEFLIYPNPSTGIFQLITSEETAEEGYSIDIFNTMGQLIKTYSNVHSQHMNLALPENSRGVFLARIKSGDAITVKRIILE